MNDVALHLLELFASKGYVVGDFPLLTDGFKHYEGDGVVEIHSPNSEVVKFSEKDLGEAFFKSGLAHIRSISGDMVEVAFYEVSSLFVEGLPLDTNGRAIQVGSTVVCVDDSIAGDSDSNFTIKAGNVYQVDSIHYEESLISPMVILKNQQDGPLFSSRFIILNNYD